MLKKLTGPGLLRLLLAEIVFLFHLSRFAVGTMAVYVFFCLSGFWIYRMYAGKYSQTRAPYFTYMVSRLWRLLPTFWLISLITFLTFYFHGTLGSYWNQANKGQLVASTVLLFGYNSMRWHPVGPAWSLDIEMQFYVLAPLLVILLASRKIPAWLVLAGIAAISAISVFGGNLVPLGSYLVFFTIGMTAAAVEWRPSGKFVTGCLGGLVAAMVICLLSPWRGLLLVGAHPGPLAVHSPAANVVMAFFVLPYAIFTTRQKGFAADGMFGDLSYVVYLLHWNGALWISWHPAGYVKRAVLSVLVWVVVMAASWAIWKFYDHPINRMRSRWVARRLRAPVHKPVPVVSNAELVRN